MKNPKYNLLVVIGTKTVLRTEDNQLNRIQIKNIFKDVEHQIIKL